jgi:hypothetical protein
VIYYFQIPDNVTIFGRTGRYWCIPRDRFPLTWSFATKHCEKIWIEEDDGTVTLIHTALKEITQPAVDMKEFLWIKLQATNLL